MVKINEINYLKNIGEAGIMHASNKPFSDPNCGSFLIGIGSILTILPPPPLKLLDLGCGTGWTSVLFAKRGYNVTGVDISPDMIKYAQLNQKKENLENLKFLIKDYENLSFDEEFDIIIFFDALHHAEDEQKALSEAHKYLKKGGICICSEPGKGHKNSKIAIEAMKKYGVIEKDMPPKKIIELGKNSGFKNFFIFPNLMMLNSVFYKKLNNLNSKEKDLRAYLSNIINSINLIRFYKKDTGIVAMIK